MIRSFFEIDLAKDGQLDEKDIKQALMEYLGMTSKAAETAMKGILDKLDIDRSGYITFSGKRIFN
jgi:Ca2+-binding EF-hand superfamily protein